MKNNLNVTREKYLKISLNIPIQNVKVLGLIEIGIHIDFNRVSPLRVLLQLFFFRKKKILAAIEQNEAAIYLI